MHEDTPQNRAEADERERLSAKKIRATTWGMLFGTWVVTLLASMIAVGAGAAAAFVVVVALTVVGYIVGLLFSVPRALALAGEAPTNGGNKPERIFSINTNLEQVSDWLTKIIVGVGLVEAQNIATFVRNGAHTIGAGFHAASNEPAELADAIALGIIVAFPCLGFLLGFYTVRLYVSRAMKETDTQVLEATRGFTLDEAKKQLTVESAKVATPQRGESPEIASPAAPLNNDLFSAVRAVLRMPLERLSETDLIARGQAQMARGDYEGAAQTFEVCVNRYGPEPKTVVEYARALMRLKPPNWARIAQLLEEARHRFTPLVPPELRRRITQYLLNAYLYQDAPDGFQAAIRLGDEYVNSADGSGDPNAYVYLADAHGQAYKYWKTQGDPERARAEVPLVKNAIEKAIATSKSTHVRKRVLAWLESLAGSGPDDDLKEVVQDYPELRALLTDSVVTSQPPDPGAKGL